MSFSSNCQRKQSAHRHQLTSKLGLSNEITGHTQIRGDALQVQRPIGPAARLKPRNTLISCCVPRRKWTTTPPHSDLSLHPSALPSSLQFVPLPHTSLFKMTLLHFTVNQLFCLTQSTGSASQPTRINRGAGCRAGSGCVVAERQKISGVDKWNNNNEKYLKNKATHSSSLWRISRDGQRCWKLRGWRKEVRSGEERDVEETTQVDAAALWRDVCVFGGRLREVGE